MDTLTQYNFFHIPKTAGTTLQHRLCSHEWAGNLSKGSTLVLTWANQTDNKLMQYRVMNDPEFDPNQQFYHALSRKRNEEFVPGNSHIIMGHCVHSGYDGKFITWLRDPLERDLSFINFSLRDKKINKNTTEGHLLRLIGNFQLDILYEWFLGYDDDTSPDYRYQIVRAELKKFYRVWDTKNFEDNWLEICEWFKLPPKQFTTSQRVAGVDFAQNLKAADELSQEVKDKHREDSIFDYLLYEEFCCGRVIPETYLDAEPDPVIE